MRCLHVIPYMNERAGGPVVVVDRLCRELSRRGIESIVLTTDSFGPPDGAGESAGRGYKMHCLPATVRRYSYATAVRAKLEALVPTCDLVHVHTLWRWTNVAAVRACRLYGAPYVLMPHGMLDPHSLGRKPLRKTLYGRLVEFPRIRCARAILYTTTQERDLAESAVAHLPPGHIVPLGADEPGETREALASAFVATHPELADRRLITFFGRVHPKKGLDLLVPAFAQAAAAQPDLHLIIAGPGDEPTDRALDENIRRHALASRVTRIGMIRGRDKWALLSASHVFVLPSYQENFAITVAEACRAGTPVIVSDRVNTGPLIAEGGAGLVVPCDVDAIAAAMLRVVGDASEARRMGDAGQALAHRAFSWSSSADALVDAYQSVLSHGRLASSTGGRGADHRSGVFAQGA